MSKHTNTILEKDVVLWVNIMLAGVILLLLFYYVMMANSIAAKNYKIQYFHDKIEELSESNGVLVSQKIAYETPAEIMKFVQIHGFVAAKNIAHIFEKGNVAQR